MTFVNWLDYVYLIRQRDKFLKWKYDNKKDIYLYSVWKKHYEQNTKDTPTT